MGITYWICILIKKADFTPSFKVGNFNFFEPATAIECIFADFGDGVTDAHRSQAAAFIECIFADRFDGVGNLHRFQTPAAIVSACCCISMGCRLKDRKVGEVGLWRGEGCRFNGFNVIYEGLYSL